ncbi:carcinoembryonic antigen-related cell adhesion molecule 5-like isoform X1 [Corythoichthys intestinalis]|uniref:carcinoembryonic antigen-related cell adhesion molecule 5-like isoform X1 n=1 Tax=Corythoichthys intestinalis TaxID=161448 RepID=UPI0025A56CBA|nr:carcinoembryonic antigen-related cell adhesion molecule 5-like isoform X1 [Corythoichthys intestinalis]
MTTTIVALLLALSAGAVARDILPPGPVDAVVGKNVTLQTLLKDPEYAFIIWNFNNEREQIPVATVGPQGLKVNAPYEGRASVDPKSGTLSLSALTAADSGDFSINVVKADGDTETAEIKLRVLEPVSGVVVTANMVEALEHNSTLVLTCNAKGSFLNFTWLNGTEPIATPAGGRLSVEQSESSSRLTIARVLRYDLSRPIICSAANKLETKKSAPFSVPVYYGPDVPKLKPSEPPRFVRAGSDFNLTCTSLCNPPAALAWYRNGTLLDGAGATLTLKVVQGRPMWDKLNQYSCKATNAKTKRVATSPVVSFAVIEPVSGVKMSHPAAAAVLLAGNSSANLSCQAAAGAVTDRTWLKDGQPLPARVAAAPDGSWIGFTTLQRDDNGLYECRLANAVSSEKAAYKMVVNFGPEEVKVSGETAVEVRDGINLRCSAASVPPANFTWKFNGTLTDIKTSTYTIAEATYKNTGTYTCQARNTVTGKSAVYTHNLSVKEEGALDEGLSDGAIAGIIIGVLAALGLAIGLVIYCRQKVPVESPY